MVSGRFARATASGNLSNGNVQSDSDSTDMMPDASALIAARNQPGMLRVRQDNTKIPGTKDAQL